MAGNIVFDLVDPATLINYVREYDNEINYNNFTLQRWLPARNNEELEYRIRTGTWQDVDVADYRAFDVPARMAGRQGFSRIRGELPPISKGIPLTEEELLRLRALQSSNDAGIINSIYADAERMIRAVQARLELARGQLLTTGKVTIAENGLAIEADFGMPAANRPTAGTAWSNPASDILSDLLAWVQLYVDTTGAMPGVMLLSRTVLGYMFSNTKMREAAAFAGTTPSRINVETIDAIFAANGLPPVELYDTNVRVEGVVTPVIPRDKVLFLPSDDEPVGTTEYGITAEAIKFRGRGLIKQEEMPGLVAFVLENDHPVQTTTVGAGLAMPILGNADLVMCADVIP